MNKVPIVIAGSRPWNGPHIKCLQAELKFPIIEVRTREELENAISSEPDLRQIFFLHWSFIVPDQIVKKFECICFHMTDVPYGRGGSPLQNLIQRGKRETKLTALKMVKELDAGPVFIKRALSLEGSTAEEIYIRASKLSCEMVKEILANDIEPIKQTGEVVKFKRRKPEDSILPTNKSLDVVHDHIRMLDAEGYPNAFLDVGGLRLEFTRSSRYDGKVVAEVKITNKLNQ